MSVFQRVTISKNSFLCQRQQDDKITEESLNNFINIVMILTQQIHGVGTQGRAEWEELTGPRLKTGMSKQTKQNL